MNDENRPKPVTKNNGKNKSIILIMLGVVLLAGIIWLVMKDSQNKKGELIKMEDNGSTSSNSPANNGPVSPISGLPCDNWNRRPIAIMQPSDVSARPASGFSKADMVIEMPVITATITRLMGVYVCNNPEEVGSMRSARHDFVHLAKGLDAIFVHWGRSQMEWFIEKLNSGVIDDMNCNGDAGASASGYCFRHPDLVGMHSGYVKFARVLDFAKDHNYRMENKFSGYAHQAEAPLEERGADKGHLRVGFPGKYAVNYTYDQASNTYLRTWGGVPDKDRLDGTRIAPKNIAVLVAKSEQIEGQYNNVQLGDPWMDTTDSGEAFYYMDGKEFKGTWKKDKSKLDSKLIFLKENGEEVKFVPGQIWVEVIEPGYGLKWQPGQAL